MIILYGNPLSTYCAKVRVVLRYKNVPFEDCPPPDGYGSPTYRRIIPMGTIPGFVDGEVVLSESEAIAEYLEETHPEPALMPGDANARESIRSLSRIHDCWVEPRLRALYAQAAPAGRDAEAVAKGITEFHRRLDDFAACAGTSPYIAGDLFSLADCAWPTTFIQAELLFEAFGQQLRMPASLVAWRERVCAQDAVAPELEACRTAMVNWLNGCGARTA